MRDTHVDCALQTVTGEVRRYGATVCTLRGFLQADADLDSAIRERHHASAVSPGLQLSRQEIATC